MGLSTHSGHKLEISFITVGVRVSLWTCLETHSGHKLKITFITVGVRVGLSTCLETHSGHKFEITFITVQVRVELFSPSNNILCKVVYLYLLSYMTYDKSYFTIEISYRKILLSLILLTFALEILLSLPSSKLLRLL